jgi:hypothetical protein
VVGVVHHESQVKRDHHLLWTWLWAKSLPTSQRGYAWHAKRIWHDLRTKVRRHHLPGGCLHERRVLIGHLGQQRLDPLGERRGVFFQLRQKLTRGQECEHTQQRQ